MDGGLEPQWAEGIPGQIQEPRAEGIPHGTHIKHGPVRGQALQGKVSPVLSLPALRKIQGLQNVALVGMQSCMRKPPGYPPPYETDEVG